MKRKFADRPNWKRVLSRRMTIQKLNSAEFSGYAVLICIDQVREALWVNLGGRKQCVADNGYSWLTLFPENERYVVTAMFNKENQIVQWYIDICKAHGLTEKNIPWYDDLYLDIIISSDLQVDLIDQDDLALALRQNIISKSEFDYAYKEAEKLMKLIAADEFALLKISLKIHGELLKVLGGKK